MKGDDNNNAPAFRRYVDAAALAAIAACPDFPQLALNVANMGHSDIAGVVCFNQLRNMNKVRLKVFRQSLDFTVNPLIQSLNCSKHNITKLL